MKPRDYFPLGKAEGAAFCNREMETQWLVDNIQACKHSLLVAPRRYGKSSLAEHAIAKSGLATIDLNFNTCSDERDVEGLIRQGVSQLIDKALNPTEKLIRSIKNYVKHLNPKLSIDAGHMHLELSVNKQTASIANITEALSLLEKLLADKKQQAVLLLDEFQTVGLIAKGKGVEAAIRNIAQGMKYLTLIFSGSNRHLLKSLFEDENRPLYKLCRKLSVNRIEELHYQKHLNQAARLAWKTNLDETTFKHIMLLSEQHPYYVNYLCDILWTECAKAPSLKQVDAAWQIVMEEERSDINAEICQLSLVQKKVLRYIAEHSDDGLLSANAVKTTGMALSSLSGALNSLLEKDVIEKQERRYQIINPAMKYFLVENIVKN